MRRLMILPLLLATAVVYTSCSKDKGNNTSQLDASKTSSIKKGEPVAFSLQGSSGTANWSVNPSTNVVVNNTGNKATVFFGKAGSYTVTGTSGSISASRTVTVLDSVFNGNGGGISYTDMPLTGDNIKLTMSKIDSGSNSGLIISAITANSYNCLNNFLVSSGSQAGTGYSIGFTGVKVPDAANCSGGQAKASSFTYFYPVADGSHSFSVTLNGTTYTGSFIKNGSSYSFSWPYSSGVTMSPLSL